MAGKLDPEYHTLVDTQGDAISVNTNGTLAVAPVDGKKFTYSSGSGAISPALNATDIWTISGSPTKTIKVLKIEVSGTQTTAGQVLVLLVIHRSPNSGGTSVALTPFAFGQDSNNPLPTATVLRYTANPTLGTPNANYRSSQVFVPAPASVSAPSIRTWDFGNRPGQAITLRTPNDVLAVNLNATTVTGGNFWINAEWTEE
jgi:hypothetical protein